MYLNFFNFKEKPFSNTPNSENLFPSPQHNAALDYIHYGIKEKKGFILITGEAGMGKTTLCRRFLKNLDKDTEAAVIFNSFLTEKELLRAINKDFGISATSQSREKLISHLNEFLLSQKKKGKTTVVMIDESQNLTPPVLEQIRMLSNLETDQEKLLQIVLLGQPELEETLAQHELRQLNQRISVRCRINPLNFKETQQYIQHRLKTTSKGEPAVKFNLLAFKQIYKNSRGIPRNINSICDYALLHAYVSESHVINLRSIRKVLNELKWPDPIPMSSSWQPKIATAIGLSVLLALGFTFALPKPAMKYPLMESRLPAPAPVIEQIVQPQNTPKPKVLALPPAKILTFPNSESALLKLASIWLENEDVYSAIQQYESPEDYFHQIGFQHVETWAGLSTLSKINLPCVLQIKEPETGKESYAILIRLSSKKALLIADRNRRKTISHNELKKLWYGKALVLYQDPEKGNFSEIYIQNMSGDGIELLQKRLFELGYLQKDPTGTFDIQTQQAIEEFQQAMGFPVDGIAGTETQLALFHLCYQESTPYLVSAQDTSTQRTLITYSQDNY